MATPAEFYDALAFEYHLLFGDWWSAAQWHGEVIADVLAMRGITDGRLRDCTCGIGTQALPLAALGFRVTGTDVSREAIARARAQATTRGLDADFEAGDVRDVRRHVAGSFDVVISCDNALPHLLTHEDLERCAVFAIAYDPGACSWPPCATTTRCGSLAPTAYRSLCMAKSGRDMALGKPGSGQRMRTLWTSSCSL
jgi:hypothetical protein